MNEIQFTNIRRNEVSVKTSTREAERRMNGSNEPFYIDATNTAKKIRQQRAALVLKNVDLIKNKMEIMKQMHQVLKWRCHFLMR